MANKNVLINLKITEVARAEFQAVALLRGSSMSNLLRQHIINMIREEKRLDQEAFSRALAEVMEVVDPSEIAEPEAREVKHKQKKK